MMFRSTIDFRILTISVLTLVLAVSCSKKASEYTKHPNNFYYKLISFANDSNRNNKGYLAILNASYATQHDSVFWTSSTDFNDKFYISVNPSESGNAIEHFVLNSNEGDSASLLIPCAEFFKQQFVTNKVPDFCKNDSVIKVNLKIAGLFNANKFDSLQFAWAAKENKLIKEYLKNNGINTYHVDGMNVHWLSGKPNAENVDKLKNKTISMSYKGYFLNGKQFDESPANWTVNPSTPDQMLKGLNYVIKYLNTGENAKIILPSYLAFGEMGTGNIVPPFTPLLYEININTIVN